MDDGCSRRAMSPSRGVALALPATLPSQLCLPAEVNLS
jgi:hypothetical protein